MKIIVLDGYCENPGDLTWDGFKKLGKLIVYDRTPQEKILERLKDAQVAITNKTLITKDIINACPQLQYIGVLATGYNVVDCQAAKEKGIIVTNIPEYGTNAVAQFTFALILEVCHRIGHHNDAVKSGKWQNNIDFCFWDFPLIELSGKTLGIIGFGRIGQAVAQLATAFGMKVIAYNKSQKTTDIKNVSMLSLDEVFEQSDIISLHCPHNPSTEGLINKNSISKMKDGVILINTSRGALIVEQDVCDALNSGKIYASAVDVVSKEPIDAQNPLLTAQNCIITPHIAWASKESRQRLMDCAVSNLHAFISGKAINVVNK